MRHLLNQSPPSFEPGSERQRQSKEDTMAKTWLITGASRGFGRQLAEAVLDAGDQLVATARQPEQLDDLVAAHGERVQAVALDVTDAAAAEAAVKTAVEAFAGLDVVVNDTRAALPVLRQQRSGTFVQFSSIGGRVGGTPGMGAYQTAKFAVEGFSEVLANEVAPFGVKVIIVEPGAFRTDWQGSSMQLHPVGPDYEQTVGEFNRSWRLANDKEPGDPARAARIIMDVIVMDEPPRRLLLGAGAVTMAQESARLRADEIEKWAELSRSGDFPSAQ